MNSPTLRFAVCANTETLTDTEHYCKEAAAEWTSEACAALSRLPFVGDVGCRSRFADWHGGPLAHQAAMYGNECFGLVVCCDGEREVTDEDGEVYTKRIRWADLTEAEKAEFTPQIWAAVEAADKARDAVERKHEALDAAHKAQEEADEEADA